VKTKRKPKGAVPAPLTAFWDTSGIVLLCCFQPNRLRRDSLRGSTRGKLFGGRPQSKPSAPSIVDPRRAFDTEGKPAGTRVSVNVLERHGTGAR